MFQMKLSILAIDGSIRYCAHLWSTRDRGGAVVQGIELFCSVLVVFL